MNDEDNPQQLLPQSINYSNPMTNFGNSIILLTNPENAVNKLECKYRNIKVLDNGKVQKLGQPLMNDYGIAQTIGMVESVTNENTVWAWLEDRKEVDCIRDYFADTLAKDLMSNRKMYGIIDPTARDRIFTEAILFVHLSLKRSFKQGERSFWKGSNTNVRHEMVNENQSGGVRSLWGLIKR
jgi:hypothetical protein